MVIDKILVSIAARLKIKRLLWPSHTDPAFFTKIDAWQKLKVSAPSRWSVRGLVVTERDIDGYRCYELSRRARPRAERILYIHGGAFVFPILRAHWRFVAKLVKATGRTAVIPFYPLVPHHTYKEIHAHLKTVYLRVLETTNPDDVTVVGDSAGGNLALVLPQIVKAELHPRQIIALSPVVDLSASHPDMDRIESRDPLLPLDTIRYLLPSYYKGLDAKDSRISPLYADYRDCRSCLTLINGGRDILSPDITALHERLLQSGVAHNYVYELDLPHAWPLLSLPSARKAHRYIASLL